MAKAKRKLTAREKAEKKRRRREYMTIFVNGILSASSLMFERAGCTGTSVKRRIMNRRNFVTSMLTFAAGLSVTSRAGGQNQAISPDLVKLADSKSFKVFNRNVSSLSDKGKKGVHLDESPGDGVAYLEGIEFGNGTIEFDVRGKDVPQQSFVGLAFHGLDGATYDAIYFRPFNFRTEDPARRIRAFTAHSPASSAIMLAMRKSYHWQPLCTR